jgi:hypothetical protein
MSRSVDLFIDSDSTVADLATQLGRLCELDFHPGPDDRSWVVRDGDVTAVLAHHPYVDDRDLVFSHFRYALSARVSSEHRIDTAPETTLLRRISERLLRGSELPVLLVLDLQYRDQATSAPSAPADSAGAGPADARSAPAGEGAAATGEGAAAAVEGAA